MRHPALVARPMDSTLSMAVLLYLGVGISSHPTRLSVALDDYFGAERAGALRDRVDELLKQAWLDPAEWSGMTLADATDEVRERMRRHHPELSEDAVQALAWNFSYNSK